MSMRLHLSEIGSVDCPEKSTVWQVAERVCPKKVHQVVGAFINQKKDISDVRTPLKDNDHVHLVCIPSQEALQVVRHSAAHVMAQAVQELWPGTQVSIGPVIDHGFYYDFDSAQRFQPEDLQKIEKKMQQIIQSEMDVTQETWTKEKALSVFQEMGESYKVRIIQELDKSEVSIYRQGNGKGSWLDLCRGPHVKNLSQIRAVKVLHQSGAYWRGDENQEQLQRIYGTAFHSEKELKQYLHHLEEAARRDHRILGKQMGLFHFSELSPGSPFFTPDGTVVYNALKSFLRNLYKKYHYEEVITPQLFHEKLFQRSGHKEHFVKNMYPVLTTHRSDVKASEEFFIKPMNCPGHCVLYSFKKRSHKDLPWRVADFGRLHRREKKGTLHGITRVNSMCQDDAHIFCTKKQLKGEIQSCLEMFQEVYSTLGLDHYQIHLSTRPPQSMGEDEVWNMAETTLQDVLKENNIPLNIQEGEGAFYGPKLDWCTTDAMNRTWQFGTLQCDFNMPKAFHLKYVDHDNTIQTPIMLHRAVLGSLERFIGVYLEHVGGYLPLWMSPTPLVLMNISRDQEEYVQQLEQQLLSVGVRVATDLRGEKLGHKVRDSYMKRVPCLAIIGAKEQAQSKVSVRFQQSKPWLMDRDLFVQKIGEIIQTKQFNAMAYLQKGS